MPNMPNTLRGPRTPTNSYISAWTERVSDCHLRHAGTQIIKDLRLTNKSPPEAMPEMPPELTLRNRLLLQKVGLCGHYTSDEKMAIIEALQKQNYECLLPDQAFRLARSIKALRKRFELVSLGNPACYEIIIKTHPLYMSWASEQVENDESVEFTEADADQEVYIGPYYVGIRRSEEEFKVWCLPAEPPSGDFRYYENARQVRYHPHLPRVDKGHNMWSELCLGDSFPDIQRWLKHGDLDRAFLKITEQLESYNPAGAFMVVKEFLCDRCPKCFASLDDDEEFCNQCTRECGQCDGRFSHSMFLICVTCSFESAKCPLCQDRERCYLCGRYTCEKCSTENDSCPFCSPVILNELGAIHAISSEVESDSSTLSVEPPNVLGTQRPGVGSVSNGVSTREVPF